MFRGNPMDRSFDFATVGSLATEGFWVERAMKFDDGAGLWVLDDFLTTNEVGISETYLTTWSQIERTSSGGLP